MLQNINHLPKDHQFKTDVCIAGAGAAGVSLARQLLVRGYRVCLLESSQDFHEPSQSLYQGDNTGMPYYALDQSRLRFFGGTTNIWGGRCGLLDPIDFAERPWLGLKGWPISYEELLPWYRSAHRELGLGDFDYDGHAQLSQALGACGLDVAQLNCIRARLWRFDAQRERFAYRQCRDLIDSPNCLVLVHANVVRVDVNKSASRAIAFQLQSLDGNRHAISAAHFVLGCGAIENARLLLLSDNVEPGGVGNRHDQVGRYFMEHPHGRIGRMHTSHAFNLWRAFNKRFCRGGPPIAPALVLSPLEQARAGILNSAVTLKLQRDPSEGLALSKRLYRQLKEDLHPTRFGRQAHHWYRAWRDLRTRTLGDSVKRLGIMRGKLQLHLIIRGEQAPNPESRVCLSGQLDRLGCRKIQLNWQLSEVDKRTANVMADILDREFRHLGLGSVEKSTWLEEPGCEWPVDSTVSNHPIGGYHHMGTTRMSKDHRHGVVDSNCTVHGYKNLHILGSSVFPTSGWVNPTLTILALAHRLGERLDQLMKEKMLVHLD